MGKQTVNVAPGHIARHAQRFTAYDAIEEAVWNSLDADAQRVDILLVEDEALGVLSKIQVQDDGSGMSHEHATSVFTQMGESWKKANRKTPKGRPVHGSKGEGRYAMFALGNHIHIESKAASSEQLSIVLNSEKLLEVEISKVEARDAEAGTTITIEELTSKSNKLTHRSVYDSLLPRFAGFIMRNPDVSISVDDERLEPRARLKQEKTVEFHYTVGTPPEEKGFVLEILEWEFRCEDRRLYYCDEAGSVLRGVSAKVQGGENARDYTAYLKSEYFREEQDALELSELNGEMKAITKVAREKLRNVFDRLDDEDRADRIKEWKKAEIYPYPREASDGLESAKRAVFDRFALRMSTVDPGFQKQNHKAKRLSLEILRHAVDHSPSDVRRIFQEVLVLTDDEQKSFADLLETTPLSSMLQCSEIVIDRLRFLQGLDEILFQAPANKVVNERDHLHRMIAKNTWLFGEKYHLTSSEKSLTSVLKKHVSIIGGDEAVVSDGAVRLHDGKIGRVDIVLTKRVPTPATVGHHHLVVELKRPGTTISSEHATQIEKYEHAVRNDPRFDKEKTTWDFVLVGNDIDPFVSGKIHQLDRSPGVLSRPGKGTIRVLTWGSIIEENRERHQKLYSALDRDIREGDGVPHLQRKFPDFMPDELSKRQAESS